MKGLRVLNTRSLNQSENLTQAIIAAGGFCVNLPALSISPTTLNWLLMMPELNTVKQAIFISSNAVNHFFSALNEQGILWPSHINVIAVGHATATTLFQQGIHVHQIPTVSDSEHLIELDTLHGIQHQVILLIKGVGGRPLIPETLLSRGANVISLDVYQRNLPEVKQEYIDALWQDDAVDIILFTSEQAMNNLFSLFTDKGRTWLRKKPCLVISPRLANAASLLGIQTIITSQHDKILEALYHYHQGAMHDNKK